MDAFRWSFGILKLVLRVLVFSEFVSVLVNDSYLRLVFPSLGAFRLWILEIGVAIHFGLSVLRGLLDHFWLYSS